MTRALSVTCLTVASFVALALFGVTADAKPAVAVLGIEVNTPDNGTVDQQTTAAATNLTLALRDRVRSGTGPYDTAPGSDKELIDLKLLNECSSEAMPCMVKIGNDLGAKFMLYGHLAKQGTTYRVSMTLLNVDNRSKGMSKSFDVPIADLASGPKGKDTLVWARRIYGEITGETSQGTVIVHLTGADHGTLLVEENGQWQPKGSITSGQGRAVLPEGKYKIGIESEGFQRFETTISVTSGSDTTVPVPMTPMPGVGPGSAEGSGAGSGAGSGSGHEYTGTVSEGTGEGWHKAFVGTAVTTGVLAVGFGVSYGMLASTGAATGAEKGFLKYGGNCDKSNLAAGGFSCKHGDALTATTYVTGIGAVLFGGFALIAMFESHRSSPSSTGEHAGLGRHSHRQFAVTPVVSPTTAGAAFRIDW